MNAIFKEIRGKGISLDEMRLELTLPYMNFWNKYFPDLTKEKCDELFSQHMVSIKSITPEGRLPTLYPYVKMTLDKLDKNGLLLCMVSSDPLNKIISFAEKEGIDEYFTEIYADAYEKETYIRSIIELRRLDCNETMYIDDLDGGILAGKVAGVKTVGAAYGFQHKRLLENAKPDYIIDSIEQLLDIVLES